ncbi:hybrid-cluster NAD(P)-dependent oxidoreductase [Photobacterium kishitanii]|uniref:Flavodoxin n=1 Tax=Photobacterium kishitanii TaxID=318456 RepID=A0AAX0YS81_9GAMM|nr:hybrid-cluster NAD(P)-dependent oxidoreductase [Photobacterium kishitanii]PSU23534.1 flavodoxin [Photobacterium kishitanii]PSX19169.1 flavodoxin [Photobacterium kishitanii]PSX28885.1 flavodoxin [Photobacterium kishitanii]PSX34612.1 flavodoxin [Photobacterium kishitanii]PSX43788.1 flavodoxin [Photobacterium kishitanii]
MEITVSQPSIVPTLSQIHVYPVKSIAALTQSQAWVEKQGLAFDRRFMVASDDGIMITARKYPQMVKITATLTMTGLVLQYPNKADLVLQYADFAMEDAAATVWNDNFSAYTTTALANQWFSEIISHSVQLLFCGQQSNRVRPKIGHNVSFADGYPLLVISEASLSALNERSSERHTMAQFRTNLVVSNTDAFAEDGWKRIRIGEVEFEAVKPCARCILTTVDPLTGYFSPLKEPLKTMATFRADALGEVFFGQNLVALNEGIIRAGDEIEILATKPKEIYADNIETKLLLTCVEREDIAADFTTFWFESHQQLPLPPYLPGQHLPLQLEINGEFISRRYTLSSSPSRPGRYAVSVKRIDDGRVSNWLHQHFQVGDVLVADKPDGDFHLGIHTDKLLLLSAGSGITPMLSMLRYLSDHDNIRDVVFYHQCRTEADIPSLQELHQLENMHPSLDLRIVLSQPRRDWEGESGRLSISHLAMISDLDKRQVFVCGPDAFMVAAKKLLLKMGVSPARYHQEAFGPLRGTLAPKQTLNLNINGHIFSGDNQKTLLEQAEIAGIGLNYSCRAGFCGVCKVTLASGQVEQPDVPGLLLQERQQGKILACCCIPKTDLEITK